MSFPVNIVVALHSEAKPIIECFDLELSHELSEFPVYENERIRLIRSGVGKQSVIRATEFLSNSDRNSRYRAWLNVGTAGHRSFEVGAGVLANKIVDQATGRSWYPSAFCSASWTCGQVITVDEAELDYQEDACFDMEAAGFYPTACRSSLIDLIFCYKVISDNMTHPVQNITRSLVNQLVNSHLPNIKGLIDELDNRFRIVSDKYLQKDLTESFSQKWRFTVTQQLLMRKLLNRCAVLGYEVTADSESIAHCRDSRAVIRTIEKTLDSHWKPI